METILNLRINIKRPKSPSGSNYCKRTSQVQNSCDEISGKRSQPPGRSGVSVGRLTNQIRQNLKTRKKNAPIGMVIHYEHGSYLMIIGQ